MGTDESKIYIALLTGICVQVIVMGFFVITIFQYYRKKAGLQLQKLKDDFQILDKEKKRIAYDLHDDVGSLLSAVKLRLHLLPAPYEQSMEVVADSEALIDEVMEKIKRISLNLMPRILERLGLDEALKDLISMLTYPASIEVSYAYSAEADKETSLHIYRIAQEVLNNVVKHSQATHLSFTIQQIKNNILLHIKDNGIGFHPHEVVKNSGQGLQNITARVAFLQAKLYLTSSPGHGADYKIEIPLSWKK